MEALQEHFKMSSLKSSNVESFLSRQNVIHNDASNDIETDEEIDIEDIDSRPTKMTDKFSIDSLLRHKCEETSTSNFLNNNKNIALSAISALMVSIKNCRD